MNKQRLAQLETYIMRQEEASIKELLHTFKISINTLRSDLRQLEDIGIIQRKYGGVKYHYRSSFEERLKRDVSYKKAICRKAAELVETGDIIYVDFGTTVSFLTDFIDPSKKITLLTSNMEVLQKSIGNRNIRLIALSGEYLQYNHGFLSDTTPLEILNHEITKAFISCDGITSNGNCLVTRISTVNVKQAVMKQAKGKYLLTCSDTFMKTAPMPFSSLSDFDMVFTDSMLKEDYENICKEQHANYFKAACGR